jgi:hypothetical protein
MSMTSHCHLAGFRARIQACTDPPQRDRPAPTTRSGLRRPPCHPARSECQLWTCQGKKSNCATAQRRTRPARRPARLQTARHGVASADGPANGQGCCAPDAVPGTARPAARRRTRQARRPACLQTARLCVASADGLADWPGCCALDAAPGTARPCPVRCRATKYKWTVDKLIATINLIKSTDFMTF